MSRGPVRIAASILTADFGNLYRVVRKLEKAGIDRLHLDVMDGHFVPNISFGPDVVAAFRRLTELPLDAHLMISEPSRYVERFLAAGADTITFHVEAEDEERTHRTLETIRAAGRGAGLAISPSTPLSATDPHRDVLDIVMVMTVEPGFGGQRFISEAAPKILEAAAIVERRPDLSGAGVHVDGGVNRETAELVASHQADVLVVGSALFQRGRDTRREVDLVRQHAAEGRRHGRQIEDPAARRSTAARSSR